MNTMILRVVLLTVLPAVLLVVRPAVAQESVSLFNGKDLTGWRGLESFWKVIDGAIVGETTPDHPTKGNTFLVWQGGEVADFDLRCQVRFQGNNSGVQYRSQMIDETAFVVAGYQLDLHPNQQNFGMLYGEKFAKRGIIAQRNQRVSIDAAGKVSVTGSVGDKTMLTDWTWNEARIVAVGNRLIHQINGVTTVDVTDSHPEAKSKGILALQLHAGKPMRVEFRDLKLRHLSAADAQKVLAEVLEDKASPEKAASPGGSSKTP